MKLVRLSRRVALVALLAGVFTWLPQEAWAFQPPAIAPLPNFDLRSQHATSPARATEQSTAVAKLRGRVPTVAVDFDALIGSPKFVSAAGGFLSGPEGKGKAISPGTVDAIGPGTSHRTTKAFLAEHRDLFGHGAEALDDARIKREFTTTHSGLKTVVWEQQVEGVPVFEAVLISHTTDRGELVNISSHFVPAPAVAADRGTPRRAALLAAPVISAAEALARAAANLGESAVAGQVSAVAVAEPTPEKRQKFLAPFLRGEGEARLVWLPMDRDTLRLCWDVLVTVRQRAELYRVLVDAQTGEAVVRRCLTDYLTNASYRVFTSDSPSPFSPGHPTPLTNQPPLLTRTLVTWAALDTNASPAGWINDGGNETLGNNVDAHTDLDNNDVADLPRPAGSPFRVFDFPMDLVTQSPSSYRPASVVQLFYLCNWMHDKLYALGFTEAAGNFQSNNFARGGLGNDAVQADAQDGGGTDNANMSTPPDGSAPRMQMYVFSGPTPDRDGDFDAEIVLHEYTHGLSNRRVGGGVGLSALQSAGMGEGWSDWYALALLSEPGDDVNANFAAGGYATYLFLAPTYQQNYYFGIRRYPYSTDLTKNPLTFKDIDPAQASANAGIPKSPVVGGGADEFHNQGEVWCMTLWEARANLIAKHGFTNGNQLILQLVTDGMNLSPANPNFLQARDAIIQADLVATGGANRTELWAAFAKRGMGASATSPDSSTTSGVFESFDPADDLSLSPATGFTANGPVGGPFTPSQLTFTLTNSGLAPLNWILTNTSLWLNVSPAGGTLTPGGPAATVTATLNTFALSLPMGIYSGSVGFTNLTSGVGMGRQFQVRVGQPDYFTEQFGSGDNDLAFSTITFTPDGSASFYAVCREVAASFPTDPTGGIPLFLTDDSFTQITLAGTNTVGIYSRRNSNGILFIGSNGYLTMEEGDTSLDQSLNSHFRLPRVSALFDDLNPNAGGAISWKQLSNRVAITFQNVPEYSAGGANSFQFELFYDGRIQLTYLALSAQTGLAGLSEGLGVPADFQESDLSAYDRCLPPLFVTLPPSTTEGAGILPGQGRVSLLDPLATNLTVHLTSSATTEIAVPASVVIPAGQTNAPFDLTVVDDAVVDGTQTAVITATAPNLAAGSAVIAVHDNETAVLQVSLPAIVSESGGSTQGVVQLSATPAANITVRLTSSDISEIQVPALVAILAEQTTAVFTATIVDDALIKGPQGAIVTAHVQNWTDGAATVTVLDNESLNLVVTLPPVAFENAGTLPGAGAVELSGPLPTNLVVSLSSSDLTEVSVPPTLTILAGQLVGVFDIAMVDDLLVDGGQPVTITASGPGFINGFATITVLDDESPPVPSNPTPPHLATNVSAEANVSWKSGAEPELVVNGGFETGSLAGWTVVNTGSGNYEINNGSFVPSSGDGPLPPFAGGFNAVTDQTGPGTHVLYQDVSLPGGDGPLLLSWAHRIRNHTSTFATNQYYRAEIQTPGGAVLAVAYATQPGDPVVNNWAERDFDLASYRGQTVRIAFIEGDNNGNFNLHLDNVSILNVSGTITNDVYFGTNPTPGAGELLGRTTNTSWDLPRLAPQTTYYWQVIAQRVGTTPGPVWQFTTRGIDHLEFGAVPSPQLVNQPFAATITARDEFNTIVTNFTGPVTLTSSAGGGVQTVQVITFIGSGDTAPGGEYQHTLAAISNHFTNFVESSTSSTNASDLQAALAGKHVFLVIEQEANGSGAAMGALGTAWAQVLSNFVYSGGIVVVCSLLESEHLILANSGLLPLTPLTAYNAISVRTNAGPHVLTEGVTSPFTAEYVHTYAASTGTVSLATVGNSQAVVISRDLGAGHVVMIGTDYFTIGTDMDRIIANAVRWAWSGSAPLANAPTNSGNFTNGVWTGDITLLSPATNAVLRADDGANHFGSSNPFQVVPTNQPPILLTQPASRSVLPGVNVSFSVSVFATPPLTFQWRRNGTDLIDGERIAGATSSVLMILNGTESDSGLYSVLVSNAFGTTPSSNALLTVSRVDHFTWSPIPSPQTTNAPFTVTIEARDSLNLVVTNFTGTVILSGAASIVPGISGPFSNGIWSGSIRVPTPTTNLVVLADDGAGHLGPSNPFHVIRAGQAPFVVTTPTSLSLHTLTNLELAVNVFGSLPLTYQWRRNGTNLSNGPRISGVTSPTLAISSTLESDAGTYTVYVTNLFGSTIGLVAALTVQALDHFTWATIPSPVSTLVPFAVTLEARDASNYLVTNFTGTVGLSASVAGTGIPVPVSPGGSGAFVAGLWQGSLSIGQAVSNVVLQADDFAGDIGVSAPFNVAQVAAFTIQPTNQNVLPGTNVTLVAAAVGTDPLRYQWRFEGTNILNATNGSFSFVNATLTNGHGNFSVVVTDDVSTATSTNAFIFVLVRPGIILQPLAQQVVQGGTALFVCQATGAPPIFYRWFTNSVACTTNTSGVFVFPNVQTNYTVRANVLNKAGNVNSSSVALTVLRDFDGDGMADLWETNYFGFSTNNAADGLLDFDGDGMNNRDEFIAGTNPTNALSLLKVFVSETNANVLQFVAQTNKTYTLLCRTNLSDAPWTVVTNIFPATSVRTIQVNSAVSPPLDPARFYRVTTPLIP